MWSLIYISSVKILFLSSYFYVKTCNLIFSFFFIHRKIFESLKKNFIAPVHVVSVVERRAFLPPGLQTGEVGFAGTY